MKRSVTPRAEAKRRRREAPCFGITIVLLLLNFTCAHNVRSDLAGLAMNSGLSVTASLLVCVIFAGSVGMNLLRTSRQPAWGCSISSGRNCRALASAWPNSSRADFGPPICYFVLHQLHGGPKPLSSKR